MIVFGIDPGTSESAFVIWNGEEITSHGLVPNETLLNAFVCGEWADPNSGVMVLEKVESFGMPVGKETFRTVFWSGRFAQGWTPKRFEEVTRREVKLHICGHVRATDANIRQALIDRFGPPGVKAHKGMLYGLKGHEYAALAVAVTFHDSHVGEIRPNVQPEF